MRYLILVLLVSVGGCDPSVEVTCYDGTYFKDGKCVPKPEPCGGCSESTPICDEARSTCVQCLESAHCTSPNASLCDSSNACKPCTANNECGHLGLALCDNGTCVECTIETEAEQCGENSCNPATHECTDTARSSADICEPCVADSECEDEGAYCVPLRFSPEGEEVTELGGYCLKEKPSETACSRPFSSPLTRTTLSGIEGKIVCGIAEPLTTCRAVLDLVEDVPKSCSTDNQCGIEGLNDGICDTPNVGGCTYACTSGAQCPDDKPCPGGGGYCGQP